MIPRRARFEDLSPRTVSAETALQLIDAVSSRAAALIACRMANGQDKAALQTRIMEDTCRRYGAPGTRLAAIPAAKGLEAKKYIINWQGEGFA